MAQRGRKPKPRAKRELEGNRGRRPLPNEPDFPVGTAPPRGLSRGARDEWNRVYKDLERAGVVTRVDRAILLKYCIYYDHFWQMTKAVDANFRKHGTHNFKTKNGSVQRNPDLITRKEAGIEMQKAAAELGITPSARTRVSPVGIGNESENPFDAFLGGGLAPDSPEAEDEKPN